MRMCHCIKRAKKFTNAEDGSQENALQSIVRIAVLYSGRPLLQLMLACNANRSIIAVAVKEPQDVEEQVDAVQVQAEYCHYPFIWAEPSLDHLSIVGDVAREDQDASRRHGHVDGVVERQEELDEPCADEKEESTKQPRSQSRQIVARLQREESESQENSCSEEQSLQDDLLVDVGDDCAQA